MKLHSNNRYSLKNISCVFTENNYEMSVLRTFQPLSASCTVRQFADCQAHDTEVLSMVTSVHLFLEQEIVLLVGTTLTFEQSGGQ